MTPADTPSPRQLSEEERALWEKASAVGGFDWYDAVNVKDAGRKWPDANFVAACSPSVILSLLTALSSEREAGERRRMPDGLQVKTSWALPVGCLYAHPDTLKMPDAQAIVDDFNAAAAAPSTETPHE